MLNIVFTDAVVLFAVLFTPVFLALFALTRRAGTEEEASARRAKRLSLLAIFIEIAAILFLLLGGHKSQLLYELLIASVVVPFLLSIRYSPETDNDYRLLIVAILLHIIAIQSFSGGVAIGERTDAVGKMLAEGHWSVGWGILHPSYNPFPADIGLKVISSLVTGVPYTRSSLNLGVILLPFLLALDLAFFSLVRRITGSGLAGAGAVFLFGLTPPCNIAAHFAKWLGAALVVLSVYTLIRASSERGRMSHALACIVGYAVAVFYHASVLIGIFFPVAALVFGFFGGKIFKAGKDLWSRLLKAKTYQTAIFLFASLWLAKAIYTQGALQSFISPIRDFFVTGVMGTGKGLVSRILYNQAVNPLQAYSWTIVPSASAALFLYSLWKRKAIGGAHPLTLFVVGASFSTLGLFMAIRGAGKVHAEVYPAYLFIAPAASLMVISVLKSPKLMASILLAVLTAFSLVAVNDPMLLPGGTAGLKGASGAAPGERVLEEASTIYPRLKGSSGRLVAGVAMGCCLGHLETLRAGSLPGRPSKARREKLISRLSEGKAPPATTYVLLSPGGEPGELYLYPGNFKPSENPSLLTYDSGLYKVIRG